MRVWRARKVQALAAAALGAQAERCVPDCVFRALPRVSVYRIEDFVY